MNADELRRTTCWCTSCMDPAQGEDRRCTPCSRQFHGEMTAEGERMTEYDMRDPVAKVRFLFNRDTGHRKVLA